MNTTDKAAPKVFLGGTCADTNWREELTSMVKDPSKLFNPVCPPGVEWNEEWRQKEEEAKRNAICSVYVFTPQMQGVYSVAEATVDALNDDKYMFFVFLDKDSSSNVSWTAAQLRSLKACGQLWSDHNARQFRDLESLAKAITNL